MGCALDPLIGLAGDGSRRRALLLAGGVGVAVSTGLSAAAVDFPTLLVALLVGNPAAGAFVSLAQATLIDRDPDARELGMARWTAAGSVGTVAGPVLVAAAVLAGVGWRGVLVVLALAAAPLALAGRNMTAPGRGEAEPDEGPAGWRALRSALVRREVLRWLLLLESADLLLDVFHGFLALYLVDVAGATAAEAALAVAVWTGAGLAGDLLLLVVLRRVRGEVWLRASALAALAAYPAFLIVPSTAPRLCLLAALGLLNAGWYALPQAGLYGSLPGRSGVAVAVGGIGGLAAAAVPALLGAIAQAGGVKTAMWLLLLAPVTLLLAVPTRPQGRVARPAAEGERR